VISVSIKPHEAAEVIARYYAGCTAGDIALMMSTLDPEVTHYFLDPQTQSVSGAEHLARYWRKVQALLDARWEIDSIVAQGQDAAIEWTIFWTEPSSGKRLTTRGAEFYRFRGELIYEIRAYYHQRRDANSALVDFPYEERAYSRET